MGRWSRFGGGSGDFLVVGATALLFAAVLASAFAAALVFH